MAIAQNLTAAPYGIFKQLVRWGSARPVLLAGSATPATSLHLDTRKHYNEKIYTYSQPTRNPTAPLNFNFVNFGS